MGWALSLRLRVVVGSMQSVADAERMGGLALHVAKIARRRHPDHVLPEEVHGLSPRWAAKRQALLVLKFNWMRNVYRGAHSQLSSEHLEKGHLRRTSRTSPQMIDH